MIVHLHGLLRTVALLPWSSSKTGTSGEGRATKSDSRQKQGGGRSHAVVVHGRRQRAVLRDAESDSEAMDPRVTEASRTDRGLNQGNKI